MAHHGKVKHPSRVEGLGWEVCKEVLETSGMTGSDRDSTDVQEEVGQRVLEPEDIRLKEARVL